MDVMSLARAERADLAALLRTLSLEQWDAPSLCSRWRVRDVVAHIVSYEGLGLFGLGQRVLKGRLRPDAVNAAGVSEHRDRTPEDLIALVERYEVPQGLTARFGGRIALTDGVIHQQDIRRPLHLPRTVPPERLRVALPFAMTSPLILGFWHARGVRVVATDLDWAAGSGPEVRGRGEAILMAVAGRHGIAEDLSGPGVDRLQRHG